MSTGTGEGFVSLMATVSSGRCRWLLDMETWIFSCTQYSGCSQATLATWAGLEPGSELALCERDGDDVLRCEFPAEIVGLLGAGLSHSASLVSCGTETGGSGGPFVYSISTEAGELSASAEVMCTPCAGS